MSKNVKMPEIRIYFSWLLNANESQSIAREMGVKPDSDEQLEAWTMNYRAAWKKFEAKIIPALQDALGVTFYKPVIDVACAPYFIPKSEPLIMNFVNLPDQFVDVLTHELCHVLLTDNNVVQIMAEKRKMDLADVWQRLFGGDHDFNTLVHIPVHALCKYIWLDVLKEPSRLDRDIDSMKEGYESAPLYIAAWDYVNKNDYRQIIANLKQSYAEAAA